MMARALALFFLLLSGWTFAQQKATIYGKVTDTDGKPVEVVNVSVFGQPYATSTEEDGTYELKVPADKSLTIVFSHLSFENQKFKVRLQPEERYQLNRSLKPSSTQMQSVTVRDEQTRKSTMVRIDPKVSTVIPTSGSGVEAILKTLPGVFSNNELSSQYNVRGGNYDENLVYVNDVAIYRPFLVRSGQQEGLSFINPDLVSNIKFSAGGFEARYGDKMSSVLDITYKKPKEFAGSVTASLLGGAVHFEGTEKSKRFSYLFGARHRTNRYVLNSLDTDGEYFPQFTDIQSLLSFDVSDKVELQLLGNYALNKYTFIPQNRETEFGTINEALRLSVFFDGREVNSFETMTGAFTTTFRPTERLKLKFITSAFNSFESETFDVQGQYFLDQLENNFGSDDLGEVAFNRGVGTYLNHARNTLDATVMNASHRGTLTSEDRSLEWGLKYQHEIIEDELNEWRLIDSAGYSVPQKPDDQIILSERLKTNIGLTSSRYMGYLQHSWFFEDTVEHALNAGVRFNYWDLNNEIVVSPRVTYSVIPNWEKDWLFRASSGYYYQPPFYRELRDLTGNINRDIKSQRSIHFVLGADYNFKAWGRPFKFVGEVYYKHLDNLIPYEIDNVRIRYYAENSASGYATGIDLKVNGEFVKDIESWVSLSVMQTREDIKNDFYYEYFNTDGEKITFATENQEVADSNRVEPGFIPRPTDQRVNFGLFFQDYIPRLPSFKMHLNLLFGTGLPFGPPSFERYKDTLRIPPYRRVDIGFSYQLLSEDKELGAKNPLRHLNSVWISAEVFNLLQVSNTISYLWISDVSGRQYAVPNYLTQRQLNVRLIAKF